MIKENNLEYEKIFEEIEYIIKSIKELFKKKKERNKNLLKLFESLIDTYELTNKINNYQIRKNILNVYPVKNIFKLEEKYYIDSFIFEFKNLSKKITDFTEPKKSDEISFINILHCPSCKNFIKIESIDTNDLEFKIKFNCPKDSNKFEDKNLSNFINENKKNNIIYNYLCDKHNESNKYFCSKCNINFCEKCKEHEEHKNNIYNFSKELLQISDINNKKINNKKELENTISLQEEYENWIKELDLKMTNYFENVKFILNCKDEIFNNLEHQKYNYSYALNCNYIIEKLQIVKKFKPQYLPQNLPHFIKYGYDVLKFLGFNAEGRPKNLCPTCYEKLGKPETYTSSFPSYCNCGKDVCNFGTFCFVCGLFLGRCDWCGRRKGGNLSGIYSLKA